MKTMIKKSDLIRYLADKELPDGILRTNGMPYKKHNFPAPKVATRYRTLWDFDDVLRWTTNLSAGTLRRDSTPQ